MLISPPFATLVFLFQNPPAFGDSAAEEILFLLIFAFVTNGLTWFFARNKNQADIGKLMAETVKTYIDAIDEIMRLNESLQSNTQTAYDEVDRWRREHRAAAELLEKTQDELNDCLESRVCHECDETLERAVKTLETAKGLIEHNPEAAELLTEISKLSDRIARRKGPPIHRTL